MTEYHIYKIKSSLTDKIYIGSTKKTLTERLSGHKYDYKTWLVDNLKYVTSFEILKFNDHVIELIESRVYIDKLERNEKEGYHIKLNKLICVNKNNPARTKEELREYKKEYRQNYPEVIKQYKQDNKQKIKEQEKQYREDNKQKIKEREKQYREDNKEKIKKAMKIYRDTHREYLKEQLNKKYVCEICNGKYTHQHKLRHEKSNKHIKMMAV